MRKILLGVGIGLMLMSPVFAGHYYHDSGDSGVCFVFGNTIICV